MMKRLFLLACMLLIACEASAMFKKILPKFNKFTEFIKRGYKTFNIPEKEIKLPEIEIVEQPQELKPDFDKLVLNYKQNPGGTLQSLPIYNQSVQEAFLKSLSTNLGKIGNRYNEMVKRNKELEKDIERTQKELNQTDKNSVLRVRELEEKIGELLETIEQNKKTLNQLQGNNEVIVSDLQKQIDEQQHKLQEELSTKEEQRQEAARNYQEAVGRLEQKEQDVLNLTNQLQKNELIIRNQENALTKTNNENSLTLSNLQNELAEVKEQNKGLLEINNSNELALTEETKTKEKAIADFGELSKLVEDQKLKLVQFQDLIAKNEEQAKNQLIEVQRNNELIVSDLQKELEMKEKERQEAARNYQEAVGRLEQAEQNILNLTNQLQKNELIIRNQEGALVKTNEENALILLNAQNELAEVKEQNKELLEINNRNELALTEELQDKQNVQRLLNEAQKENKTLKNDLTIAENEIKNLQETTQTTMDENAQKLNDAATTIKNLQEQIEQSQGKIGALENLAENTKKEKDRFEELNRGKTETIQKLEDELEKAKEQVNASRQEVITLQEQYKKEIEDLRKQIGQQELRNGELLNINNSLVTQNSELENTNNLLMATNGDLLKENTKLSNNETEFNNELNNFRMKIEELTNNTAGLNIRNEDLANENAEIKKANDILVEENTQIKSDTEKVTESLRLLSSENKNLTEAINKQKDQISVLQEQLAKVPEQIETAAQKAVQEFKNTELLDLITDAHAKGRIEGIVQKGNELETQHKKEIANLQEIIEQQKKDVDQIKSALESVNIERDKEKKNNEVKTQQVKDLAQELNKNNIIINNNENEIQNLKMQVTNIPSLIKNASEEAVQEFKTTELPDLLTDAHAKGRIEGIVQKGNELETQHKKEIADLQEVIEQQKKEVGQIKNENNEQLKEKEAKINALENLVQNTKAEKDRFEELSNGKTVRIEELESELEKTKGLVDTSKQNIIVLQEQLAKVPEQIENATKKTVQEFKNTELPDLISDAYAKGRIEGIVQKGNELETQHKKDMDQIKNNDELIVSNLQKQIDEQQRNLQQDIITKEEQRQEAARNYQEAVGKLEQSEQNVRNLVTQLDKNEVTIKNLQDALVEAKKENEIVLLNTQKEIAEIKQKNSELIKLNNDNQLTLTQESMAREKALRDFNKLSELEARQREELERLKREREEEARRRVEEEQRRRREAREREKREEKERRDREERERRERERLRERIEKEILSGVHKIPNFPPENPNKPITFDRGVLEPLITERPERIDVRGSTIPTIPGMHQPGTTQEQSPRSDQGGNGSQGQELRDDSNFVGQPQGDSNTKFDQENTPLEQSREKEQTSSVPTPKPGMVSPSPITYSGRGSQPQYIPPYSPWPTTEDRGITGKTLDFPEFPGVDASTQQGPSFGEKGKLSPIERKVEHERDTIGRNKSLFEQTIESLPTELKKSVGEGYGLVQ